MAAALHGNGVDGAEVGRANAEIAAGAAEDDRFRL